MMDDDWRGGVGGGGADAVADTLPAERPAMADVRLDCGAGRGA